MTTIGNDKTVTYCTPVMYTTTTAEDSQIDQGVYYSAHLPPQTTFKRKKNRVYKQKYLNQWEQDERFQGWITQCREDVDFAFCTICNCKVLARTASVTAHHNSSKHKKKLLLNGLEWTLADSAPKKDEVVSDNEERVIPNFYEPSDEEGEDDGDASKNSSPTPFLVSDFIDESNISLDDDIDDDLDSIGVTSSSRKRTSTTYINRGKRRRGRPSSSHSSSKSSSNYSTTVKRGRSKKKCPHCSHSEADCKNTSDGCLIYGKYVGNELRQIMDETAIEVVKSKINSIILEAKSGIYNKRHKTEDHIKSIEDSEAAMIHVPTSYINEEESVSDNQELN